jgi:hypothetical protein
MLESWRSARERFEARQSRFLDERVEGTEPSLPLGGYAGWYGGAMYGDATMWRETFAWFGQGAATFILDPYGEVTEVKLDVPNDDLWFHELELRKRGR